MTGPSADSRYFNGPLIRNSEDLVSFSWSLSGTSEGSESFVGSGTETSEDSQSFKGSLECSLTGTSEESFLE